MNKLFVSRLLRLIFAILIVLLLARIVILALGANPGSPLVIFLLAASDPLTLPFRPFFKPLPPLGFVGLDDAAIVALLTAALLAWLILRLLRTED